MRAPDAMSSVSQALTGLKAIFIEQRAKEVELRQVADLLGRAGEMEMGIYGFQKSDSKIVFNDAGVRNLVVKIRGYDDQRTISSLFKLAVKDRLTKGSLEEFNHHADDFLEKIKEFPGGVREKTIKNTRDFSVRIKVKAKQHYTDPTDELTKADLEKVTELYYLANNQLTKVPKGLEKLTKLRLLHLAGNQLTDVNGLEKFTQLKELWLTNNPDLTKAQVAEVQNLRQPQEVINPPH